MLTEQLFEHWQVDAKAIVDTVYDAVGPCDVLLGGSLADDLAHVMSDVDLYCFSSAPAVDVARPVAAECGDATLELHLVDVGTAEGCGPSLAELVTSEAPLEPQQWPLLSPQEIRRLHAAYRDNALSTGTGAVEVFRRRTAPDLLHVYVALRSVLTCAALAEDVVTLVDPDEVWSSMYCSRLAVESAIDAALSCQGLVNPNAKWRVPLVRRAALLSPDFPATADLIAALFPDPTDPVAATATCIRAAARCLDVVGASGFLSLFPLVPSTVRYFTDLAAEVAAEVAL